MGSSLDYTQLLDAVDDIDTAREAIRALRARFQMVGFDIGPDEVQAELMRDLNTSDFLDSDPDQAQKMLTDLAPRIATHALMSTRDFLREDLEEVALHAVRTELEKTAKLLNGEDGEPYRAVLFVKRGTRTTKAAEKTFEDAPAGHTWAKSWHGKTFSELDPQDVLSHRFPIDADEFIIGHSIEVDRENPEFFGIRTTTGFAMEA